MNLLFIYGPPAVGKLTTASLVAARTGYKGLHNHLAFDIAASLFEPFSPPFRKTLQQVRMLGIGAGIDGGLSGIILTMCYDHPRDNEIVDELHSVVRFHGGRVQLVHLVCGIQELKKRVVSPERSLFKKVTNPEKLDAILQRWNLFTSIENHPGLRIDNTLQTAEAVAEQIIRHYGIPARSL